MAKLVEVSIGGRKLVVTENTAELIRQASRRIERRNAEIDRELRSSRMLPREPSNQFVGWLGKAKDLHTDQIKADRVFHVE